MIRYYKKCRRCKKPFTKWKINKDGWESNLCKECYRAYKLEVGSINKAKRVNKDGCNK